MNHNKDKLQERWIFMTPAGSLKSCFGKNDKEPSDISTPCLLSLRHPFTAQPAKFLLDTDKKLYEMNGQRDKHSSWFVDKYVQQDGTVFILTPFDPLFLILPYLSRNADSKKYLLLDQVLRDEEYPECCKLSQCISNDQVSNLSDSSGSGDYVGYRYNQEKTLKWLSRKVRDTACAVKEAGIFIAPDEERSSGKENEDMELIEYAFGIVSSYLDQDLSAHLEKRFNIRIRSRAEKRQSMEHAGHLKAKRPKNETLAEDKKNKPIATTKLTKAQRELKKVDKKGMKSISSFFSPSNKK